MGLAFPDLGKEGSLGGLIFGMPPKVTDRTSMAARDAAATAPLRQDDDTSYHLEGFYRYKLSDNLSITPGSGGDL